MSFAIIWNFPALATFYRLPMHAAVMIDRAVIRFAATGEGQIEWVAPHYRLRRRRRFLGRCAHVPQQQGDARAAAPHVAEGAAE